MFETRFWSLILFAGPFCRLSTSPKSGPAKSCFVSLLQVRNNPKMGPFPGSVFGTVFTIFQMASNWFNLLWFEEQLLPLTRVTCVAVLFVGSFCVDSTSAAGSTENVECKSKVGGSFKILGSSALQVELQDARCTWKNRSFQVIFSDHYPTDERRAELVESCNLFWVADPSLLWRDNLEKSERTVK